MAKPFQYHFEWDSSKARQNLRKHGLTFERAASIFQDPDALSEFDEYHSEQEERWITLGLDNGGSLLAVVHTFEQVNEEVYRIRIISARKAEPLEVMQYEEHNR